MSDGKWCWYYVRSGDLIFLWYECDAIWKWWDVIFVWYDVMCVICCDMCDVIWKWRVAIWVWYVVIWVWYVVIWVCCGDTPTISCHIISISLRITPISHITPYHNTTRPYHVTSLYITLYISGTSWVSTTLSKLCQNITPISQYIHMCSPAAPSDLILIESEGQIQGHPYLKRLLVYHRKEQSSSLYY